MHALILLFVMAMQYSQVQTVSAIHEKVLSGGGIYSGVQTVSLAPLKVYPNVPPMAASCKSGETAAVRYDKNNVEQVACHKRLACADGTAYGAGACVCRPGMPLLDQDDVVTGCTKQAPTANASSPASAPASR